MIYLKVALLASGLWVVGVAQLPLSSAATIGTWPALLLVLRLALLHVVGRAVTTSVMRFAALAAVIWTFGAIVIGATTSADVEAIARHALDAGLLRAARFACALSWSMLMLAWVRPDEIYLIPWLPKEVRAFFVVFRVFVARSIVLVGDILDGLHAIGLPHGSAVVKSLVFVSVPFPTHGLWAEGRAMRFALLRRAYLGLLLAYLDLLLAEEMPEVEAALRSLSED